MSTIRHRLALAGVLAVALGLRLIDLGARPIWYDEAFSILLARQSLPAIVAGTAADTMPPLYYFLLHAWMYLTDSIAGLRLLNVVLGVGLVGVFYWWGRQWISPEVGLVAGAMAAFSPFLIYHAQELRMYSLLGVACLIYVLLTQRWLESEPPDWRLAAGVTVAAAAALYSHNLAGFTLIVPNVVLVARRQWASLRRLLLPQAGALLLFSPWLALVPGQVRKIQTAFWTPVPAAQELIQALLTVHTHLPLPQTQLPIALFFSLLLLVLAIYGHWRSLKQPTADRGLIVGYLVVPPALLLLLSYVMRPVFVPRALMLSAVAYFLLLAWMIAGAPALGLRWLAAISFAAPLLLALPAHYQYRAFPRSPFPAASRYLLEHLQSDELILHDNKLSYFPMRVYAPELSMVFLPDEPGSHNDTLARATQQALGEFPATSLEQAVANHDRVWFVVFQRALDEYAALGQPQHPVLVQLEASFTRQQTQAFGDLLLIELAREGAGLTSTEKVSGTGSAGAIHDD